MIKNAVARNAYSAIANDARHRRTSSGTARAAAAMTSPRSWRCQDCSLRYGDAGAEPDTANSDS
jgi:hypothetical protein